MAAGDNTVGPAPDCKVVQIIRHLFAPAMSPNNVLQVILPATSMDHTDEAVGRPGQQFQTCLPAQGFPALEHDVRGVTVFDVLEYDQIVCELRTEITAKAASPMDKRNRSKKSQRVVSFCNDTARFIRGTAGENPGQVSFPVAGRQNFPFDGNGPKELR